MIIWFSLGFPILAAFFLFFKFRKKLEWYKIVVPVLIVTGVISIFKFTVEKIQTTDTEYWSGLIQRVDYYEPWSTWVTETCSRQYACGSSTDSKGNSTTTYCTEYYDCSYCDNHGPEWIAVNDQNEKFPITYEYYVALQKKWSSQPKLYNLNRHINYDGGCGQDGNMYEILWNNDPFTSEATFKSHHYENRVKAAKDKFNYETISEKTAKEYELYSYPEISGFHQQTILGVDKLVWLDNNTKYRDEKLAEYLSGYYGHKKQLRLWVLIFTDKTPEIAKKQQAYWMNGNKNEMVVCIGVNSSSHAIEWVEPFSWTTNESLCSTISDHVMSCKTYDFQNIYNYLNIDLGNFERKHFKDFSYLTVEPPTWCIVLSYLLSIGLTVVISWKVLKNNQN